MVRRKGGQKRDGRQKQTGKREWHQWQTPEGQRHTEESEEASHDAGRASLEGRFLEEVPCNTSLPTCRRRHVVVNPLAIHVQVPPIHVCIMMSLFCL